MGPPQRPRCLGLSTSHPTDTDPPTHLVETRSIQVWVSHRDPSVPVWAGLLHKDPNIPVWSHTPGRCPSMCPPPSQEPRGPSTGPSISHRDPDVPARASNNPEKPRCPDLVPSHPREVAQLGSPRTTRTPGVLVRTPQYPSDPNVLARSPQGPSTPKEPQ